MDLYTGTSSVSCTSGQNAWTITGTINLDGVFPGHKVFVGSRTADVPSNALRMFRIATIDRTAKTFTTHDNADQTYTNAPFFIDFDGTDTVGFATFLFTTVLNQLSTMFGVGSAQFAGGGSQFMLPRDVGASAVAELAFALRSGATHTRSFFWRQREVSGAEVLELIATPNGTTEISVLTVNRATGALTIGADQSPAFTLRGDANYTILSTDRDIIINAAFTAGRTFTLPANSARAVNGRVRIIDGIGAISPARPLTITRAGSDTINGETSIVITRPRAVIDIIKTGTGLWSVDTSALGDPVQNAARIASVQVLASAIAPAGTGAAAIGAASLMDKIAALGIGTPPSLILDFLTDSYMIRERALAGSIAGLLTALGGGSATRGSSAWFFNSSGVLTEATSNNLRLDHDPVTLARRGLLIEGARTNSFTNNTMAGASAGTPGTAPTNWQLSTAPTGMTREIVGTGTEDGINYIDVAFTGTNTSGAEQTLQFLAANVTAITAAAGDTWTLSFFARRVAGSWPAGNVMASLRYGDAGGSALAFVTVDIKSMGTGALRTQRWTATGTAPASTTRVTGGLYITVANGETVNFTVRIGLPQLELGIFPSTPIKTSSGAVTRSADALIIPGAAWLNPSEGSIYSETLVPHGITSSGTPSYDGPRIRSSGSNNESLLFRNFDVSGARRADMTVISGGSAILDGADTTIGTAVSRGAGRYKATDFANSVNGGSVQATATALPANLAELQCSSQGQLCRRFIVFPVGLANAQLQALSGATL
jgi:hypothetical protein